MKLSTFSLFAQVLWLIDRRKFGALASEHAVEKSSKGFGSWLQFVAMLFAQLSDAASLREISLGLASASGKLRHLGVDSAPSRSTLAYANAHRPWEFFRDVFAALYATAASEAKRLKRRFQFKNPLYALDSTTIPLCLGMFDWARYRRTKGAVKLHLLLDRQGCLPRWAKVTDGKRADVKVAWTLDPRPGSVVAMDRGYNDYALFAKWHKQRVYFVTRMKDNAQYEVVEERPVPGRADAESDETIVL